MALENPNAPTSTVEAEGRKYLIKQRRAQEVERLLVKALTALNVSDITGVLTQLAEDPEDGMAIGLQLVTFLNGANADDLADVLAATTEDVLLILDDGSTRKLVSTDIEKVSTLAQLRMAWFSLNVA